jgi:hypothetical protein
MRSARYISLVTIYLIGHFISIINKDETTRPLLIHNQTFILGISTFIFFLIIKSDENNCSDETKKLPQSYIYSQAIFYSILAIFSQYIYKFFVEKNCLQILTITINNINDFTYIPEALFIAGFVLLTNNLSLYVIYPKCNKKII